MKSTQTLLIVGASARAAAQAAVRDGWQVAAVDLFADADLQAVCPTWQVAMECYPQGLIDAARQAPPGPWMFCGGLENYADVVAAICRERELLGVDAKWLDMLRNPQGFANQLEHWGVPSSTLVTKAARPESGSWLLKPTRSAGGRDMRRYDAPPYPICDNQHYWSRWIDGVPQSAVYLFAGEKMRLLGVTEQLIGTPWTGGSDFLYCGNIGPFKTEDHVLEQYRYLGNRLAELGILHGLIGVDAVLASDGRIHPLEINPRYTASMELLERGFDIPLIDWHVRACLGEPIQSLEMNRRNDEQVHGKAILYARQRRVIDESIARWCMDQNEVPTWPVLADLPMPGTNIAVGHPLLTVFAAGGCAEETRYALRKRAEQVFARVEA